MTSLKKSLVVFAVAVLAGTAIYQALQHGGPGKDGGNESLVEGIRSKRQQSAGRSIVEQMAGTGAEESPVDRRKELEILKSKWLETESSNYPANIKRQVELSKESAEKLLCSPEMLELMKFVEVHEFYNTLESAVAAMFRWPHGAEARKLLAKLPETTQMVGERSYKASGKPIRDKWAYAAGKHCPEEEFEAFVESLHCDSCAAEAHYGRNYARMPNDPLGAFRSSLEVFESGVPSISGRGGLTKLFRADLPEDMPWETLEEMLPVESTSGTHRLDPDPPLEEVRKDLIWKWSETDPATATHHIMAHPDRLSPTLMRDVIGGCSAGAPGETVPLVSALPDGRYFDEAATSAAVYARGQPGIHELIARIQDPKLRKKAEERVKVPLANPDTR